MSSFFGTPCTHFSVVADEGDDYSMRVCGDILKHDREQMSHTVMKVGGLMFFFYIWIIRDGKVNNMFLSFYSLSIFSIK